MDTVLGLSLTPTVVGWVLIDAADPDRAPLAGEEFGAAAAGGAGAAATRAAELVLRLRDQVAQQGRRLRGVGVTWSGDAAAEAALLTESLVDAGVDNVVPVPFRQAAADPAGTALCTVEPPSASVLLVGADDDAPTSEHRAIGGADDVFEWLSTLFAAGADRPELLVLSGRAAGLAALAARLRAGLGVPVRVDSGLSVELARGAALALEPTPGPEPRLGTARRRSQRLSYAGALTMLVAGALTFVVSVSIALSLQLGGASDRAVRPVADRPATPVLGHPAPLVTEAPVAMDGAAALDSMWEVPPVAEAPAAGPAEEPGLGRSLLNRVLDRISGLRGR